MDSGLPRSFWEQQTSELKASADRHCPPRSRHAVGSLPLGRWDPHCLLRRNFHFHVLNSGTT